MTEKLYEDAIKRLLLATYREQGDESKAAIKEAAALQTRLSKNACAQIRRQAEASVWKEHVESAGPRGATPSTKSRPPPCRGPSGAGKKKKKKKSAASANVKRIADSAVTANPVCGGPDSWQCHDCKTTQSWDEMCDCGLTWDD